MASISSACLSFSLSFRVLLSPSYLMTTTTTTTTNLSKVLARNTEASRWPHACLGCFVPRRQTLRRWSVHHRDDLFYAPPRKMIDARESADFDLSILPDFTRIIGTECIRAFWVSACVCYVFFIQCISTSWACITGNYCKIFIPQFDRKYRKSEK